MPISMCANFPNAFRAASARSFRAFGKFQASDTVAWFESRGVKLKIESDGRMFPMTDSSQTIIDCLLNAARKAGIKLKTNCGVESAAKKSSGGFELTLSSGEILSCDKLLLAIGGCRTPALGQLAVSLGHSLNRPCRRCSLFTLKLHGCANSPEFPSKLSRRPFLKQNFASAARCCVTHWGLSGPAILRLSAWGARALHGKNYQFTLQINWLPHLTEEKIAAEFQ